MNRGRGRRRRRVVRGDSPNNAARRGPGLRVGDFPGVRCGAGQLAGRRFPGCSLRGRRAARTCAESFARRASRKGVTSSVACACFGLRRVLGFCRSRKGVTSSLACAGSGRGGGEGVADVKPIDDVTALGTKGDLRLVGDPRGTVAGRRESGFSSPMRRRGRTAHCALRSQRRPVSVTSPSVAA